MKSITTLLFIFLFVFPISAQWTAMNSGTDAWLRGVWFTSANEGVVVGYNGRILKTYDGGETWELKLSGTNRNLFSVFFADENTGYITGAGGTILKTITGGETWLKIQEGGPTFHESYFLTPSFGYIAGEGGTALKTEDGGASFEVLELGSFNGKVSTFFNDENTGYFVGIGYAESLQKTTDGGDNFLGMYVDGFAEFGSVYFTDYNIGYVCNLGTPKILKTTDGGLSWEEQLFNFNKGLYALKFEGYDNGFAVGGFPDESIILKTTDAGDSWQQEVTPNNEPLFDVFMFNENYAFAVGRDGTILRLGEPSAVSTQELETSSIKIFPNPASDYIIIEGNDSLESDAAYTLIDSRGKMIKTAQVDAQVPISLEGLSAGFYIIKVATTNGNLSFKFFKQ